MKPKRLHTNDNWDIEIHRYLDVFILKFYDLNIGDGSVPTTVRKYNDFTSVLEWLYLDFGPLEVENYIVSHGMPSSEEWV